MHAVCIPLLRRFDVLSNQKFPAELVYLRDWIGWMAVARVQKADNGEYNVAGRLVDMEDFDRGMLSLYLSTQPLAA